MLVCSTATTPQSDLAIQMYEDMEKGVSVLGWLKDTANIQACNRKISKWQVAQERPHLNENM